MSEDTTRHGDSRAGFAPQANPAPHTELAHPTVELPGPQARALIEADSRLLSPSYTRPYPLVVERGRGMWIEDVDGHRFLDFTAGIAVCATGHCHPRVVEAIRKQAAELIHMSGTDFHYRRQIELAEKLVALVPGSCAKRVFFTNSGAEAVEAAIKLARHHTRRPYLIAFHGAFHGRTLGALSLTASKTVQREGFGPLVPGVYHVPFPDPYRTPHRSGRDAVREIEQRLFGHLVAPEEVAAIVVEPIQGEGGYIVPPPDFHPALRELTARYGILYVVDEIQTGMGRTGKMLAIEHWGVEPDVVCLAKGLASGMPLGAIVARAELMDWPPGAHASTFGGNPVSCAAALETIALLEQGLIDNARRQGERLRQGCCELANKHRLIGDVRGLGLMLGLDLVTDRKSKQPAVAARDAVIQACFRRGLLLLGCGESVIRLCPPLIVETGQVDQALAILDEALSEVAAECPHIEQPSQMSAERC